MEELNAEVEMQEQEHQTSEVELMNETLIMMEETQGIDEIATSLEQPGASTGMEFVRAYNFLLHFTCTGFFSVFMNFIFMLDGNTKFEETHWKWVHSTSFNTSNKDTTSPEKNTKKVCQAICTPKTKKT